MVGYMVCFVHLFPQLLLQGFLWNCNNMRWSLGTKYKEQRNNKKKEPRCFLFYIIVQNCTGCTRGSEFCGGHQGKVPCHQVYNLLKQALEWNMFICVWAQESTWREVTKRIVRKYINWDGEKTPMALKRFFFFLSFT